MALLVRCACTMSARLNNRILRKAFFIIEFIHDYQMRVLDAHANGAHAFSLICLYNVLSVAYHKARRPVFRGYIS